MRIAVDAMGGDHAPDAIVDGACAAVTEGLCDSRIALIGKPELIKQRLGLNGSPHPEIDIVQASERVDNEESAATSVKRKKDSSIAVAARLVKEGEASALVSAGHTGAVMAASFFTWGRLKGVSRPAIASGIPTAKGTPCILLDVGANVDCKPVQLLHFALMGHVYAEEVYGISNPRVGLLSIGEEKTKGNDLVLQTYPLLENSDLNFIGNVEGGDIINGQVDVVVCDGAVGNILLKFGEGIAKFTFNAMKESVSQSILAKIGAGLMKKSLVGLKKRLDYTEYGGAPLLGVNGVCIICHGGSQAKAIKNAVKVAQEFVNHKVNDRIVEAIAAHNDKYGKTNGK